MICKISFSLFDLQKNHYLSESLLFMFYIFLHLLWNSSYDNADLQMSLQETAIYEYI